jgi:hypothetical protein
MFFYILLIYFKTDIKIKSNDTLDTATFENFQDIVFVFALLAGYKMSKNAYYLLFTKGVKEFNVITVLPK